MINGLYPGDYDSSDPAAFLNLLFVPDEVGTTIETGHFAFDQLGTAAAGSHEKLRIANFTVEKSGVVVIYLSNESADFKEVYFDDFVVKVTQSNILHATDYYPFGLAIRERSLEREKYRFQYQGQFAEYDEETGRNNFKLRSWDSMLGRWLVPDPYRQYWSSYVGMGNNPTNLVDPDGGCARDDTPCIDAAQSAGFTSQADIDAFLNANITVNATFDKMIPQIGDKVMGHRDGWGIGLITFLFGPRTYYGYDVDDKGYITGASPTLAIYDGPTSFGGNVSKLGKGALNLAKRLGKSAKPGKLPTPDINKSQFTKLKGNQGFRHNNTGAVYKKSNTTHGSVHDIQWKAYPKGTTDFSKNSGNRITIDGDGSIIGN